GLSVGPPSAVTKSDCPTSTCKGCSARRRISSSFTHFSGTARRNFSSAHRILGTKKGNTCSVKPTSTPPFSQKKARPLLYINMGTGLEICYLFSLTMSYPPTSAHSLH